MKETVCFTETAWSRPTGLGSVVPELDSPVARPLAFGALTPVPSAGFVVDALRALLPHRFGGVVLLLVGALAISLGACPGGAECS